MVNKQITDQILDEEGSNAIDVTKSEKRNYNARSRTSREAETRIAQIRQMRSANSESLDVPHGAIRDGFSAHWGRMSIRGMEDHRIEALVNKGLEPVPVDRIKGYHAPDPLQRGRGEQKYITKRNELVLMEYPTALLEEDNAEFARKCREKMKSVPFKRDDDINRIVLMGN